MKYSLAATFRNGTKTASGHATAASALSVVTDLQQQGVREIQIFDIRTGRLMDEAALQRADVDAQRLARLTVRS